jgi:phage tail-like protein
MADANDNFVPPLFTFRFHVKFVRESIGGGGSGSAEDLCQGAFSEIAGLEATLEPKAIREGGLNYGAHQRAGQVSFGTVVLKRGVTSARHLWQWWALFTGATDDSTSKTGAYAHRMTVTVTLKDANDRPQMRWRLDRAMPVKFKAADFNARATEVGIEELHLAHEGLYAEAV